MFVQKQVIRLIIKHFCKSYSERINFFYLTLMLYHSCFLI